VRQAPVHLYIYYRIAAPHAADARPALAGIMEALERRFSISGRLLFAQDDAALWMEIYEGVVEPAPFEAALNASLAQASFESWLAPGSMRRTERFVSAPA
jgi:hypothetical protein